MVDNIPRSRSIFFPRRDFDPEPSVDNATNYFIEVENGVRIGCRFYTKGSGYPSLLYFHGNGEIVSDHDSLGPIYNGREINLFVADYRGYGFSDGEPTLTNLIQDVHPIFEGFKEVIKNLGYKKSIYVMGRSLGSTPAIELACTYQDELKGIIVESGFAFNRQKIQSIQIPTLVIHGERDRIIPLKRGLELYENAGAKNKSLLVIPNAGHNNLINFGYDLYFNAIEKFVKSIEK